VSDLLQSPKLIEGVKVTTWKKEDISMNLKIKKYHFIPFILFLLVINVVYAQAGPLATNPETGEYYTTQPDTSVTNPGTNELYPRAEKGTPDQNVLEYYPRGESGNIVINPEIGAYYPRLGNGVINPKTGEYYPKMGPFYSIPSGTGKTGEAEE
jgi:hypothetical protein